MKKIIITILCIFVSTSAFAACSITGGACSAPVNFEPDSLQDKQSPNTLKNFQKTDYFQPQINTPYGMNINTTQNPAKINQKTADCQFGECLP